MGWITRKRKPPKPDSAKTIDKTADKPAVPPGHDDDEREDGDFATPKRDRDDPDNEPL